MDAQTRSQAFLFNVRSTSFFGSVITGLAIQSGIKALFEYAEGMAMAANPLTAFLAPGHFAAATAYGTLPPLPVPRESASV